MIWKAFLCGLALVLARFLIGWIIETIRIVRLQNLLSNEYTPFMDYLIKVSSLEKEWEYGTTPLPDSMRLMYRASGANQVLYLKYGGKLSRGKAIDKLILGYKSYINR